MWRLYFAFVLFPVVSLAQSLEEKLQGTWLSINITDSLGNPASGEFGGPRNFLKFQFEGRRLFIALSPFDKGANFRITYTENYFDLVNSSHSQKQYRVKLLTKESLLLETVANNKKTIYHFTNSFKYTNDLDQVSNVRHYEKLILEMTYVKSANGYYFSSYYLIDNSILNLLPSPLFVDKEFFSLGSYLEANLRIPLMTMKDLNGRETVFEFDVTDKGIENISILEKLGDEVDFQIYDLIRGMNKKWEPLVVDNKVRITRLRLKLSFSFKEQ